MSTYLLDVNVLIAMLDAQHVAHQRAKQWFEALEAVMDLSPSEGKVVPDAT